LCARSSDEDDDGDDGRDPDDGVSGDDGSMSYPILRKRERSLQTCAQDVKITRMATIDKQMQCYK
jgi:hypothetical protein